MARDLYAVLGLEKGADEAEIKKAYRKLAKQHHPDLNPDDKGAEERFKEASNAFAILGDPERRAAYDRGEIDAKGDPTFAGAGRPGSRQSGARQGPYYRDFAEGPGGRKYTYAYTEDGPEGMGAGGFDDILNQFFGGRGAGPGAGFGAGPGGRGEAGGFAFPGADARYALAVEFLDAVNGATRQIQLPDGSQLNVRIPPGLRDGQVLRLKGKGQTGIGGAPPGDALVEVTVRPHPRFRRKGDDIEIDLPITLPEAVLGAKIPAPTVTGQVSITVPKGANTGTVLRLKGRGVPAHGRHPAGDQLVRLQVMLPAQIDPDLERLVADWARTHPYDPRAGKGEGGTAQDGASGA